MIFIYSNTLEQEELNQWLEQLTVAIGELSSPGASRSQTLPARAAETSGEKKSAASKKTKTMLPA